MLFFLSVLAFISLVILLAVYYRDRVVPFLPQRIRRLFPQFLHYTPLSTFSEQAAGGFTSASFDIESNNLMEGDSRMGLDENGVQEVQEIMRRERVNFDQARLIRHNRILARNGIDPSGMPLDSKAITRL